MWEKSVDLLPNARGTLRGVLESARDKAEIRKKALFEGDDLEDKRKKIEGQINSISADIKEVVGGWKIRLEKKNSEIKADISAIAKENATIEEKTKSTTKTGSYKVSTSKWYNPFSWGSYRREYYTYEESYTYLSATEAAGKINALMLDGQKEIQRLFSESINEKEMKRKLLDVITSNFDMGSDKYDASLFRSIVTDSISNIKIPSIKVDCSDAVKQITGNFSGEITDSSGKSNLINALSNAVMRTFDALISRMEAGVSDFKKSLDDIGNRLQGDLIKDVNEEFDKIKGLLQNKKAESEKLDRYINLLKKEIGDLN
jgi:hypothetical protein